MRTYACNVHLRVLCHLCGALPCTVHLSTEILQLLAQTLAKSYLQGVRFSKVRQGLSTGVLQQTAPQIVSRDVRTMQTPTNNYKLHTAPMCSTDLLHKLSWAWAWHGYGYHGQCHISSRVGRNNCHKQAFTIKRSQNAHEPPIHGPLLVRLKPKRTCLFPAKAAWRMAVHM